MKSLPHRRTLAVLLMPIFTAALLLAAGPRRKNSITTLEDIAEAKKGLSSLPPATKIPQPDGTTRAASELLKALSNHEKSLPVLHSNADTQASGPSTQLLEAGMLLSSSATGDARPSDLVRPRPGPTFYSLGEIFECFSPSGCNHRNPEVIIKYKLRPDWAFDKVNLGTDPKQATLVSISPYGSTDLIVHLEVTPISLTQTTFQPAYQAWVYVKPSTGVKQQRGMPNPNAIKTATKPK